MNWRIFLEIVFVTVIIVVICFMFHQYRSQKEKEFLTLLPMDTELDEEALFISSAEKEASMFKESFTCELNHIIYIKIEDFLATTKDHKGTVVFEFPDGQRVFLSLHKLLATRDIRQAICSEKGDKP